MPIFLLYLILFVLITFVHFTDQQLISEPKIGKKFEKFQKFRIFLQFMWMASMHGILADRALNGR